MHLVHTHQNMETSFTVGEHKNATKSNRFVQLPVGGCERLSQEYVDGALF